MLVHLGPRETTLFDLTDRLSRLFKEDRRVVQELVKLLRDGRVRTRTGRPMRLDELEPNADGSSEA